MPESPKQPAWEDVSLADINQLAADDNVPQALFLAKLRSGVLQKASAEIESDIDQDEIPLENWQAIKKDLELEIAQLQEFIERYEQNPKYRQ